MAQKYKVKVLRVQGINNKTYVAGETVYDYNFPEGNAQKLVSEGKLVCEETKAEEKARIKAEEQAKKEAEKKAKEEADAKLKAEEQAKKEEAK